MRQKNLHYAAKSIISSKKLIIYAIISLGGNIMMKNNTKTLQVSDFHSLYEAVLEAQTILENYGRFYDNVRIISDSGKCIKIVRRYQ